MRPSELSSPRGIVLCFGFLSLFVILQAVIKCPFSIVRASAPYYITVYCCTSLLALRATPTWKIWRILGKDRAPSSEKDGVRNKRKRSRSLEHLN